MTLVISVAALSAVPGKFIRDDYFGFSASIPAALIACAPEPRQGNHFFVLPLANETCRDIKLDKIFSQTGDAVMVNLSYNSDGAIHSLDDLKSSCPAGSDIVSDAGRNLVIPTVDTVTCSSKDGGQSSLTVMAIVPEGDDLLSNIILEVDMISTPENYQRNLSFLRTVLRSMKFKSKSRSAQ